jgi:signal transduction histidine kinase
MSQFFDQIFILLTTPPGNLIYHIVLVFTIAGTLLGAIQLLRSDQFPYMRRLVFGLVILLGLQVLLFIASALPMQGVLDPGTLLPPLDRAVTLLSLVWITWLWAFPEPVRLADFAALLLSLLGLALFGLTLAFWVQVSGTSFNTSIFEMIWQGFSLAVALLGILVLSMRRRGGWGNGLAMLLLALLGHLLSLVWPLAGDFPGFVRLTQLALFPLLLTIVPRSPIIVSEPKPAIKKGKSKKEEPIQERRRYSTDPRTFHALMSLAAEDSSDKISRAMTRGIAQAMLADLCFLILMGKDKSLSIACGYDLIREETLDGTPISKDAIPLLANAIQRGRPLRLPGSSSSADLKGIGQTLGISNPGHLLCVPVASHERGTLGAILILSPYSNRLWSAEDQSYLSNVSTLFIPILERGQRASLLEAERNQADQELRSAQQEALEVKKKHDTALKELEQLNARVSQSESQAGDVAALLAIQEESQKTIDFLQKQVEQLRQSREAGGLSGESKQLEKELRQTLEELARMQNAQAESNGKIHELEQRSTPPITSEQVEVIASISQELRQPMSSIIGYTDLLLGESVGILGALQRKFVERIKASTERVGGLADDLIQITNLETGKLKFKAESIDLNLIVDNAIAYNSTQIREKNITLRLDTPENPPRLQTDRDALQQIFIHLLQNATAVSPAEGIITLRVQMQSESEKHFISIQVTDTGGGIATEDIPRVFARRYRAEHSLIQGVGDTGVGLSIARSLVESQHGRIWVETEPGTGSTFSVLLPVLLDSEEAE